jgi:hypothetical protein
VTTISLRVESSRDASFFPTLGTPTPEGHLRLIDLVAEGVARLETRRRADHAVHVNHVAADATDEVMVIVAHTIFIASGRSHGLNSAEKVVVHQHVECVVHGLARDRAEVEAHDRSYIVCTHMGSTRHRSKDS